MHAADCYDHECTGACVALPADKPSMTRDQKIALAGATILAALGKDDQLEPDHSLDFDAPDIVMFRAMTPTCQRAIDLGNAVGEALSAASIAIDGVPGSDECKVEFRVKVGAP